MASSVATPSPRLLRTCLAEPWILSALAEEVHLPRRAPSLRLARLTADVAALPVADGRTPEDIIGYDDAGLPS